MRPLRTPRADLGPPESIVVSTLKAAEDGDGVILRLYNPTPLPRDARVEFGAALKRLRRVRLDERSL